MFVLPPPGRLVSWCWCPDVFPCTHTQELRMCRRRRRFMDQETSASAEKKLNLEGALALGNDTYRLGGRGWREVLPPFPRTTVASSSRVSFLYLFIITGVKKWCLLKRFDSPEVCKQPSTDVTHILLYSNKQEPAGSRCSLIGPNPAPGCCLGSTSTMMNSHCVFLCFPTCPFILWFLHVQISGEFLSVLVLWHKTVFT